MGESCLAKYWEDNKFYPVEIKGLSKTTAVVLFMEYGNWEEVDINDLWPLHDEEGRDDRRDDRGGDRDRDRERM